VSRREKMQLLFSRGSYFPPFSIPTRDASPPLVLAFFTARFGQLNQANLIAFALHDDSARLCKPV
uniref:hypothetical protein n=1 Tax=Prevotellamassilia timonensis TaxID=1852370 RepID=UPI00402851EB